MSKKLKYIKTFKQFINENMKIDIEPYYDFIVRGSVIFYPTNY